MSKPQLVLTDRYGNVHMVAFSAIEHIKLNHMAHSVELNISFSSSYEIFLPEDKSLEEIKAELLSGFYQENVS